MNPRRVLSATFWMAILIQTLGSVDVGPNAPEPKRKMPSPKGYAAICLVWGILGWAAQLSENIGRMAATLSGVMVVTTLFVNVARPDRFTTAGTRLVHFFNRVAEIFAPPAPPVPTNGTPPTSPPTIVT